MNWIKSAFLLTLGFVLLEMSSCLKIIQAQVNSSRKFSLIQGKPPVDDRPEDREPLGTRTPVDRCEKTDNNTSFTPVLPVTGDKFADDRFSGFTLTGHPTFWFYVPYKASSIAGASFSLVNKQTNTEFYSTDLALPETPGFVEISIPVKQKPLDKNQVYQWEFTLYCDSNDFSLRVYNKGLIKRVDLVSLEAQLKTATLDERINLYIKNKIWYDVSIDLVQINNHPKAWLDLLRAVGLKQLEQKPITGSALATE
jgi:hypothetical protein